MSYREEDQAKKKQEDREEALALFRRRERFTRVFGTNDGREELSELIERNWFFSTTFTNSGVTAFREGERNVVLKLLADCPGLVGEVILDRCRRKEKEITENLMEKLDGRSE